MIDMVVNFLSARLRMDRLSIEKWIQLGVPDSNTARTCSKLHCADKQEYDNLQVSNSCDDSLAGYQH